MTTTLPSLINPIDRESLRTQVRAAKPFPNVCIDNFLDPAFAEQVRVSFPSLEEARRIGRAFSAVNEMNKVQVTDSSTFAEPVAELNRALASEELRALLSYAFEIPNLLADEKLIGGGLHQTGPRGRLDVHVDFNLIRDRQLHRRLNILIYFNRDWHDDWGGNIELWDSEVKVCHHSFVPVFNRCIIFETNEISFHGVTAVRCPEGETRKSFAAYYYTREAPAHWNGRFHTTVFRARPDEFFKGAVLMPIDQTRRWLRRRFSGLTRKIKG